MKTYIIKILTPIGPILKVYKDSQPLEEFEAELIKEYGQFTQLSCNEIK